MCQFPGFKADRSRVWYLAVVVVECSWKTPYNLDSMRYLSVSALFIPTIANFSKRELSILTCKTEECCIGWCLTSLEDMVQFWVSAIAFPWDMATWKFTLHRQARSFVWIVYSDMFLRFHKLVAASVFQSDTGFHPSHNGSLINFRDHWFNGLVWIAFEKLTKPG